MKIVAAKSLLKANDQLAAVNRQRFEAADVYAINVVGSPGCGKTTLIEAIFRSLPAELRLAVIEGDVASTVDAERMEALGVPVVQINTEGACHLDATMVATAVEQLDLDAADLLLIENVGNLVCTAGFDLGEHLRIVVLSVTEGDDKVVKYPALFQGSDALFVTKVDLLPHATFSMERIKADMRRLAPSASIFQVSALEEEGIEPAFDWLMKQCGQSLAQSMPRPYSPTVMPGCAAGWNASVETRADREAWTSWPGDSVMR
jgi:hydrogenase nickel incorporation protein HypB